MIVGYDASNDARPAPGPESEHKTQHKVSHGSVSEVTDEVIAVASRIHLNPGEDVARAFTTGLLQPTT